MSNLSEEIINKELAVRLTEIYVEKEYRIYLSKKDIQKTYLDMLKTVEKGAIND